MPLTCRSWMGFVHDATTYVGILIRSGCARLSNPYGSTMSCFRTYAVMSSILMPRMHLLTTVNILFGNSKMSKTYSKLRCESLERGYRLGTYGCGKNHWNPPYLYFRSILYKDGGQQIPRSNGCKTMGPQASNLPLCDREPTIAGKADLTVAPRLLRNLDDEIRSIFRF